MSEMIFQTDEIVVWALNDLICVSAAAACHGHKLSSGAETGHVSVGTEGSFGSGVVSVGSQLHHVLLTVVVMKQVSRGLCDQNQDAQTSAWRHTASVSSVYCDKGPEHKDRMLPHRSGPHLHQTLC